MRIEDYCKWKDSNITDEEWQALVDAPNEVWEKLSKKELDDYYWRELEEEENQKSLMSKYLKNLGVKSLECEITYKDFECKWKNVFCKDISIQRQKECFMDEYLWHAFSYELIEADKKGKEAKKEFDAIDKSDVFVFCENTKEVYHLHFPKEFKIYMLRLVYGDDIYFVNTEFTWTFILKHEGQPVWKKLS